MIRYVIGVPAEVHRLYSKTFFKRGAFITHCITTLFTLLALFLSQLEALNSDYHSDCELDETYQNYDCYCLCPEYSEEAAEIKDTAYILFCDLISTTALSNLIEDEQVQRELVGNTSCFLNIHELARSFVDQRFRFSYYYHVCHTIENFAISKYEERETAIIKDSLQDILEALYPKFFALYTSCYKNHPTPEIDREILFIKLLVNDISGLETTIFSSDSMSDSSKTQNSYDVGDSMVANLQSASVPGELDTPVVLRVDYLQSSPESDFFLLQGAFYNDNLLYQEAIKVLTLAIQFNPNNREAYIERATAYFETNQLPLALDDYKSAKNLTIVPPLKPGNHDAMMMGKLYIPENKIEFCKGLVSGIIDGAKVSVVEFVPSIFSCCRGISNGLWAFVCSPIDVSNEMVNTAYAIGEYIYYHSTEECLHCVVPELKELSLTWGNLNDYFRGQKIGYIIGKYGVDIFGPIGTWSGVQKVRALKRANTMITLESCASSEVKQMKILEESVKRATLRETIISNSIKNGKILVRDSNTQFHIMQPKHAWDKLVKITGNVEEDCKKVIKLLEENQIFLEKYRLRQVQDFQNFIRYDHQMVINGHEVRAVFNKNLETGEIFLNDAWLITK